MPSDRKLPDAETAGPVLIGIDVGTSSVRALAFDARGRRVAAAAQPTPVRNLPTGGDYDPDALFASALAALAEVAATLAGRPVAGIAVASIGESCVLVDAAGRPLAPSIAWHDRRTVAEAQEIARAIGPDRVFALSGHAVDPIFTLAKLLWMRRNWPEAFARARRMLMIADWIAFRLCGEAATDPTLASRTLAFDIRRGCWSQDLLALAGIPLDFPAPLAASGTALGAMRRDLLAGIGLAGTPVVAVAGHDHIIGAIAAGLNEPGAVVDSIGTAEALLLATPRPLDDPAVVGRGYVQGAIATDEHFSYVCGSLQCAGGAIEWLRSIAGNPPQANLIAAASDLPVGSGGVIFLPHLANGPAPHPDDHARGAFLGLSQATGTAALYRAVLEGLAMQARLMLDGMTDLPGVVPAGAIRLIGGATRNPLLLAIKASVFARPLLVVEEPEATALGAALCAGVGAGVHASFGDAFRGLDRREFVVEPDAAAVERYDRLRASVFAQLPARLRPINGRSAPAAGGQGSQPPGAPPR